MKNSTLRFVLIVSLVLNFTMLSAVGYFFYRHYKRKHSPFSGLPRLERHVFEKLKLKPEQISAIQLKSASFCSDFTRKKQKIAQLKKVLFFTLAMDNPEKEKIDEGIRNISAAQTEAMTLMANHILDEKGVLDDQQQDEYFNLLSDSVEKRSRFACQLPEQK